MTTASETVTAGEWAQNVCGAVGVWRGELEAIVEDIRTPSAAAPAGEEPQSETPQGRTGFVREGLERGIEAAETLVEGIDNAGIPDTPQGEEAAEAGLRLGGLGADDLEEAQDSLDEEADTLEESLEQLTGAAGASRPCWQRRADDRRCRAPRSRARSALRTRAPASNCARRRAR